MAFIPISDNNLVNLDRVDLVRVDSVEIEGVAKRVVMVVVGGSAHRVEDKFLPEVLPLLLTKGNNLSKQYFSV